MSRPRDNKPSIFDALRSRGIIARRNSDDEEAPTLSGSGSFRGNTGGRAREPHMETETPLSRQEQEELDYAIAVALQETDDQREQPYDPHDFLFEDTAPPSSGSRIAQAAEKRRMEQEMRGKPNALSGVARARAGASSSARAGAGAQQAGGAGGAGGSGGTGGAGTAMPRKIHGLDTSMLDESHEWPSRGSSVEYEGKEYPLNLSHEVSPMCLGQKRSLYDLACETPFTLSNRNDKAFYTIPPLRLEGSQEQLKHEFVIRDVKEFHVDCQKQFSIGDGCVIGCRISIPKQYDMTTQSEFIKYICNVDSHRVRKYTFEMVYGFTDAQYEDLHNFIQTVFPIDHESEALPEAELIRKSDVEFVTNCDMLSMRYKLGFVRFLRSIGLALNMTHDWIIITDQDMLSQKVRPKNHNLRRISRVLRSLKLFGFESYANALFRFLIAKQHEGVLKVSEETLAHWCRAKQG